MQQQWTISGSDCDVWWKVDFIWQLVIISSVVGLWSGKSLSKAKLAPEKVVVSVCGLLPVYPLQLSESWWNHYIWEVHLANWWDALKTAMPAASIVQPKGPNSAQHLPAGCTANAPKAERIGLWSFAIHHIHVNSCQLTTTSSSIFTTFCRQNASTASSRQKVLSKSSSNPKASSLCSRNKQTYFSSAKTC